MRLIIITVESFFEREAEAINMLFDNGLELLHIRKPHSTTNEMRNFIELIDRKFHNMIVVHDNYELTKTFDLKGVHLNRRNKGMYNKDAFSPYKRASDSLSSDLLQEALSSTTLPYPALSSEALLLDAQSAALQKERLSVSISCHSFEEVIESRHFCDYLFFSPVFDSISKPGYEHGFTHEQLNNARDKGIIDERVVALGGITIEQIPLIREYGFGGIAILGALWNRFFDEKDLEKLWIRFKDCLNLSKEL